MERVKKALPRSGLLLVAAVGFAVLWTALLLLGVVIHSEPVEIVAVLGLVGTCVVIGLVGRNQAVELRSLAHTDPLTGLSNHRGFHEALERELSRAARLGDEVSLVSIDLDDFKAINDTHGHPYGDEVLRGIGSKLRSALRGEDIPARVGGEEFALILPGSSSDSAYEVTERAREAISRVPVHGFELSCSAGIATYPADAEDASTLIQLADGALYWAKSAGKQRTRRFDPERVKRRLSNRQADEIRAVLETPGALVPVFQPVAALSTGRLLGYEALARFPAAPSRSPAAWFAMAHGCGLGPALEALAIKEALQPLGRPPGTHLAVNVRPSVLLTTAVQEVLPDDLTEVVIEVTEHEALTEDQAVRAALQELRDRGARIAVDDAGAGYSGLKQLTQVEPDIVKLDRILTEGIHEDPARMALVESFVRFARRTGAIVCGEGISNLDQASALADLDVEWGQGFVLGRPAAPWATIPAHAARVCRAGLEEAMRPRPTAQERIIAGDRGLERLSAQLAATRLHRDLEDVLPLMCTELNADEATVSLYQGGDTIETLAETSKDDRTVWNLSEYPLTARVLRSQEAVQVMVSDPETEPSEVDLLLSLGYGSVLMVPIVHAGESVGVIEAYSVEERAWARTEINRARIISNQFASLIQTFAPGPDRAAADGSTER